MNSNSINEYGNKVQIKDIFANLKSDYFLKTVFDILHKKTSLNIIKYNKKNRKRINININDYKEYSEKYSSIEIVIKLANNKYGKFINISNEEENYYHIYFDNNKKEIKRNYTFKNEKIKTIKVIIEHQVKSFYSLFDSCFYIESINFKKFYRNDINVMCGMFNNCALLKELNLDNFKTNNVIDMSFMFCKCKSLKKLNLNNFNTGKVTSMYDMFFRCSSLEELNLNSFNTIKVTNMNYMFGDCSSLKKLNLNNFNTSNVTNMGCMFYGCQSLKELNIDNFNTDNVTTMHSMFRQCSFELRKKIKTQYKKIKKEAF